MTLVDFQGHFSCFYMKISVAYFLVSDKRTTLPVTLGEGHFRYYKRFHCLHHKKYSICNVQGQLQQLDAYVSNYFCCHI